jgi:pimeloyl-ACP methyl ester carboxylesterase
MPTTASQYSGLPNKLVRAANGVDYAYRDTGPEATGVPLVLFQHFRGNLDNWDPALIDALATARRVITFDNAGVGGSTGTTPGPRGADGPRRHRLHRRHGTRPG